MELEVEGMTCPHCVKTVEQALSGVPGVTAARVTLGKPGDRLGPDVSGLAWVSGSPDLPALLAAVAEAGYRARLVNGAEGGER